MSVYRAQLNLRRRSARFAMTMTLAAAGVVAGRAQTPPYAEFQYGTLSGAGNTITITQLPVVTSSGTVYQDVVIQFDVSATGGLTIAPGYPTVVKAPISFIYNFLAGNYTSGESGYSITVTGPGATSGGATVWSQNTPSNGSCGTRPGNSTWYAFSGPMTKHPLYTRLKNAGITATTYGFYMWGYTGVTSCSPGTNWGDNTLIGVSQTGPALTFSSFTEGGVDKNQPAETVSYTLIANQ